MSGHQRFCGAAFLLLAGFSSTPAFSNPLTDLFNLGEKEVPAAPTPVQEKCVLQPGNSAAPGRHWVYHLDGHRKCWFQADEATVSVKKQIHHHAPKQPAIAFEKSEAPLRRKAILDARAQLSKAASAEAPRSMPEAVYEASVPAHEPTALPLAEPNAARPPGRVTPQSVDVEMLLAASMADEDRASPPESIASSGSPSVAVQNDWGLMAGPAGMVLIALGFVFLAGSWLTSRFFGPRAAPIYRASASAQQQKQRHRLASAQAPEFLMR